MRFRNVMFKCISIPQDEMRVVEVDTTRDGGLYTVPAIAFIPVGSNSVRLSPKGAAELGRRLTEWAASHGAVEKSEWVDL